MGGFNRFRFGLILVLFSVGIFLMSAGFGLTVGQFDLIADIAVQTPVFKVPVSDAPLIPQGIIDAVNKTRREEGLNELKRDSGLDFITYVRATNILKNGDFSHEATRSGGLVYIVIADRLLIKYQKIGENLAIGYFDGDEKNLVNAWLNSPPHKDILLGDYNKVGVYTLLGNFNGITTEVAVLITGKE